MDKNIKNCFHFSVIAILSLFVVAAFWYVGVFSRSVVPERNFSVSGEGKIIAVPDVAELSFGVLTEGGKNLADLQKGNTDKINKIISFLKQQGIDEKDIKTQYYNISPRYQYYRCSIPSGGEVMVCPPSEIIGYSINQSVSVKIRDLNKVGDVLTGVVDRGANTVSGPTFTIDDQTVLENQAREEAIKKAKDKAKAIAKAGGFRLGKLISIQEGIVLPIPPYPLLLKGVEGAGGPTIEPGSQEVKVNVTLTYEIR